MFIRRNRSYFDFTAYHVFTWKGSVARHAGGPASSAGPRSSDPLVGGPECELGGTDQGIGGNSRNTQARQQEVVETRRLELLTLSLQRRCSSS